MPRAPQQHAPAATYEATRAAAADGAPGHPLIARRAALARAELLCAVGAGGGAGLDGLMAAYDGIPDDLAGRGFAPREGPPRGVVQARLGTGRAGVARRRGSGS